MLWTVFDFLSMKDLYRIQVVSKHMYLALIPTKFPVLQNNKYYYMRGLKKKLIECKLLKKPGFKTTFERHGLLKLPHNSLK